MRLVSLIVVMLIPIFAWAANTSQPVDNPTINRLLEYASSPEYFSAVGEVIKGGEDDIAPDCKPHQMAGRAGFVILAIPTFSADGTLLTGRWKDRIKVERCGKEITHNVLVEIKPGSNPMIGLLLPGDTGATAEMQERGDVVKKAIDAAMTGASCTDPSTLIISDTHPDKVLAPVAADPAGRMISGKWNEIWNFRACGKPSNVSVEFTVGPKGISFDAKPAK